MYVVVQHQIKNPEASFQRGVRLMYGDGAPKSVHVLQFYPSQDSTKVTCLFEADSVESVQGWVDGVLGDSSDNLCYPVAEEPAFAERPLGLAATPKVRT
jgi:hypothetical protein